MFSSLRSVQRRGLVNKQRFSYIPGHFHAFYLIFVYYYRKDQRKKGIPIAADAPLIFSDRVQYGGNPGSYQPYHHGPRY